MPLLLVITLPTLREPVYSAHVFTVLGPVLRPELTVNGEPLSQIHRLPKSHPPKSVLAQCGMASPNMWPLPIGRVYCEVMVNACGMSKLERPRSSATLKLSRGAAKPLPSPPVAAERSLSMALLQV